MDCPQELETSFVTVALRFPPSRPQATVITEPHVRWPATIYHSGIHMGQTNDPYSGFSD